VKTNTGYIRKERGWRVNTIDCDPAEGARIYWDCPPGMKFWAILPFGTVTRTKSVEMVPSKNGKATFTMPIRALGKSARGKDNPFFYCILLTDGKKMHYVHGNTPPKIIIW
jgi:hypothetical protein